MNIQTIAPDPSITDCISSIVLLKHTQVYHEAVLPLIANGHPSITFQLTDPARILSAGKRSDQLVLYGQNTKPIQLHTAGAITVIAYFLYPYMLYPLFGFQAKELTNLGIDLGFTYPAKQMNLKEQLLHSSATEDRIQLMNHYVLKLSQIRKLGVNRSILFATRLIQQHQGALQLGQLRKELHVTERTLQRLFEQHIGLTPKLYSRICQFRSAFRQLSERHFTGMIEAALDHGYADQSHLIRAFNEFTNYAPLEYLKQANDFPA